MNAEEAIKLLRQDKEDTEKLILAEATAIAALKKQIPKIRYNPDDEQNGHFYMVNGYMTCRKTGKDIRYPLISFEDLDYCPRCGQALVCSEVKK